MLLLALVPLKDQNKDTGTLHSCSLFWSWIRWSVTMLAHSTQHTAHKRTQTGACEENGGNGLDSSNANGRERERELLLPLRGRLLWTPSEVCLQCVHLKRASFSFLAKLTPCSLSSATTTTTTTTICLSCSDVSPLSLFLHSPLSLFLSFSLGCLTCLLFCKVGTTEQ